MFARNCLAAIEIDLDLASVLVRDFLHGANFLAQAQRDTVLAQVVAEVVAQLIVDESEKFIAFVDDRDSHTERCKHGSVLAADDARAGYGQRAWQALQ